MKRITRFLLSIGLIFIGLSAFAVQADDKAGVYAVTITNLTRGTTLTPVMVATHKRGVQIFQLGEAASTGLAALAEGGDIEPLSARLMNSGVAYDIASNGELLAPGASTTIMVKMARHFRHVTVASMLIPTNDAFIAVNGVKGPKKRHHQKVIMSPAYDAGSEPNDELCANIPGPACGGEGGSPDADGEGYVHIHAGIQGIGDLVSADYDWRNPTARIVIKRVK
ncbi:MAG: spondin domain-containing protein [Gammaproteobacteria bacterium]|nr:spondin domain-containing protein [Gammaproteobacteria bacterium]